MQPQDSQDLHDLPLIVDVRSKKRSDSNELTNVVKGYRQHGVAPVVGAAVAPVAGAPVAAATNAIAVGGPAPWKRG